MDRGAAVAVTVVLGGALAAQAPLNAMLGRSVGGLPATVVAFTVGLISLLLAATLAGGLGGLARIGDAPWYAVLGGGLIGAAYVLSIVWTVRPLGAGGLIAVTISAQFALAVLIDHHGWLGIDRSPVTLAKLAGLALLAAGTYLVIRE